MLLIIAILHRAGGRLLTFLLLLELAPKRSRRSASADRAAVDRRGRRAETPAPPAPRADGRAAEVGAAGLRRAGARAAARTPARSASSCIQAGYRRSPARCRSTGRPACILPAALGGGALLLLPLLGVSRRLRSLMAVVWLGGLGWVGPTFYRPEPAQGAPEGDAEGHAGHARHAGGLRRGGPRASTRRSCGWPTRSTT